MTAIDYAAAIDYATEVSRQILSHSFTSHQPFHAVLFFVHPITGHVGPVGEEKFSCTLSLTLAVDSVV
jgi:hypothetical protein